jgi:hypothetical protein
MKCEARDEIVRVLHRETGEKHTETNTERTNERTNEHVDMRRSVLRVGRDLVRLVSDVARHCNGNTSAEHDNDNDNDSDYLTIVEMFCR